MPWQRKYASSLDAGEANRRRAVKHYGEASEAMTCGARLASGENAIGAAAVISKRCPTAPEHESDIVVA